MQLKTLSPAIKVFVRLDQGANIGLIDTGEGHIVLDTPTFPSDMETLLDVAGVSPQNVRLVINTHYHPDHTWGNQVFDCPIVAHRLCRETMEVKLKDAWTPKGIEKMLTEYKITEPEAAADIRRRLADLQITVPTDVMDDHRKMRLGNVRLELIHTNGHTPGSIVAWFPEDKILFAGDLLFIGRYPYIDEADIPSLIEALKRLTEFAAKTIVPGHGPLCKEAEVADLRDYLQSTWEWVKAELDKGLRVEEIASDPNAPRYVEEDEPPGRRMQNVRVVAEQVAKQERMAQQQ